MDKLVIDTSVVVKWFVVEPFSFAARQVLNAYQGGLTSVLAPDILAAEFANTIWKKQLFQGLGENDAEDILAAFAKLQIVYTPTTTLIDEAYKLAVTHRRSVYDALYLALSAREDCKLVTADEKFVNALHGSPFEIVWIRHWS